MSHYYEYLIIQPWNKKTNFNLYLHIIIWQCFLNNLGGEKMRSISEYQYNKSNYSMDNISGQAFWYSNGAILSVSLMSGFGIPWEFDKSKISNWLAVLNCSDIEHIIPENITILRAVYKKGDPIFLNDCSDNKNDYHNYLWDSSSFKKIISPAAQSHLIMDEITLAKLMYKRCCTIEDSCEDTNRIKAIALLLINSAILQSEFMSGFLRNDSGLFVSKEDKSKNPIEDIELEDAEESPSVSDQALAMKAFSMLFGVLTDDGYPLFKNPYYASICRKYAHEICSMFMDSPDDVFNSKAKDLCNIISSFIQYYYVNPTSELLSYICVITLELESRIDMSGNLIRFPGESDLTSSSSCFAAIKCLIESYRVTGIDKFLSAAQLIYKKLNILWDSVNNLYMLDSDDKYKYTLRDVGSVLSGLNAIRLFGSEEYKLDGEAKLISFFHSAVNASGLLQSCIPPPDEKQVDGLYDCSKSKAGKITVENFCYPDIPQFPGAYTAPIFAKKFTYKPKKHKFNVNSKSFYSDYSLYAIFEILCINYPDVDCFSTAAPCKDENQSLQIDEGSNVKEIPLDNNESNKIPV